MFIFASIALFLVFLTNVVAGAFGYAQFLDDTGEMLVLLAASVAFVVVTLKREAASKNNQE